VHRSRLECLSLAVISTLEPTQAEPLVLVDVKGMILDLSAINRLRLKWLTVTNTLAYYDTELVTAVKIIEETLGQMLYNF
jgi:hypothetical protein